jgi:hypothetical protein
MSVGNSKLLGKTSMKLGKSLAAFLIFTLLLTLTLNLGLGITKAQSTTYKISGYVLDSNGHGIPGADVILNVPSVVPGVHTDNSGYYQTSGPSGTYHMNVWPPFDSNYVDYDQPSFAVASDLTKNVTLPTGYKVSGYISDSSGAPVVGTCVFLNGYGSGWFSTSAGYYFVAVPAGTYTIDAHPRVGTYQGPTTIFPTYNEYNFVVNSDTTKNITVRNSSPTPTSTATDSTRFEISGYVTDTNGNGIANAEVIFNVPSIVPSVWTDSLGYYSMRAPTGTYHINVWPPYDSNFIDYDQSGFVVVSDAAKNITLCTGYKVSGYISDYSGTPMTGTVVLLNNYGSGWFSTSNGYYFLSVPAGTYTINAHPRTDSYSGLASKFPTYYEYNFTVSADTSKNITVGSPTATPTSTPTSRPTPTPVPAIMPAYTPQPIVMPTPTPTQPATSKSSFAVGQQAVQPSENSLVNDAVLIVIVVVFVTAMIALVGIFRNKQEIYYRHE